MGFDDFGDCANDVRPSSLKQDAQQGLPSTSSSSERQDTSFINVFKFLTRSLFGVRGGAKACSRKARKRPGIEPVDLIVANRPESDTTDIFNERRGGGLYSRTDVFLARLSKRLGGIIRPQGPGSNDRNRLERVLNILTCVPFFIVGWHFRRTAHIKGFGRAIMAVGVVASLYHSSSGRLRLIFRKADYWSIASSAMLLRAEVIGGLPTTATVVMAALIPVKPTLVTALNFLAVEVQCANMVTLSLWAGEGLHYHWLLHVVTALSAAASFGLEDIFSGTMMEPIAHGMWHCLAAAGIVTTAPMLTYLHGSLL